MEKRIILITHSAMALGIQKTLEFIVGDTTALDVIQAYTVDQEPEARLLELLDQYREDQVVVLTDIFFGSVNQFCIPYMEEQGIFLITGINLPLILSLLDAQPQEIDLPFLERLVEESRDGIKLMNTLMNDLSAPGETASEKGDFL